MLWGIEHVIGAQLVCPHDDLAVDPTFVPKQPSIYNYILLNLFNSALNVMDLHILD